jgi:beta-phosphoglucomutase
MTYSGIIFDFNGVLWWDAPLVEEGWQRSARKIRGRPLSAEEFAQFVYGRFNRDTLEYLTGRPLGNEEARRLTDKREAFYRELCLQQGEAFRLSPGARELLDFLRRREIPRAIATASEKENVDFFIRQLGLDEWFDEGRIIFDDGTIPGKPKPDIYLRAAAALGLAPAQCIVVEDALSGIQSARSAGIGHVIGITSSQNAETLREAGAHEAAENLGVVERERLFD